MGCARRVGSVCGHYRNQSLYCLHCISTMAYDNALVFTIVWFAQPRPASRIASEARICPVAQRNCATSRKTHPTIETHYSGAIIMLLRFHNGVFRYQQRTFPLPLGKTRFLATGTIDVRCAWALCSHGEHGNTLFYWRFHDPHPYLLVMTSLLLLEFVTLEERFAIDL
jgi:hypothetical protein